MAKTVDVLTSDGQKAGQVTLPPAVFEAEVNLPLLHQVVVAQLAAARQGTHATKTRAEVSGGGRKPWRQKGTGRARQGSRRAPQWVGGGTVHGPQPRSYAQRTPKKMVAAALRSALSDRVADGRLFVLESIVTTEKPSTKQALAALDVIGEYRTALVVLHRDEDKAWLSLRNVPYVHAIAVDQLNVYDVVNNQVVVFTQAALTEYLERLGVYQAQPDEAQPDEAQPDEADQADAAESGDEPVDTAEADTAEAESPETAPETAADTAEVEVPESATPAGETDYGEGSYRGANPPEGYDIKGNEGSMKFHTPASPWYKRTVAEVWFNSAEAAQAAGFVDVMEGKK